MRRDTRVALVIAGAVVAQVVIAYLIGTVDRPGIAAGAAAGRWLVAFAGFGAVTTFAIGLAIVISRDRP